MLRCLGKISEEPEKKKTCHVRGGPGHIDTWAHPAPGHVHPQGSRLWGRSRDYHPMTQQAESPPPFTVETIYCEALLLSPAADDKRLNALIKNNNLFVRRIQWSGFWGHSTLRLDEQISSPIASSMPVSIQCIAALKTSERRVLSLFHFEGTKVWVCFNSSPPPANC